MQSPLRDERDTLERRLEALKAENARLRAEVAKLPARKRRFKPWIVALLCLFVAPLAAVRGVLGRLGPFREHEPMTENEALLLSIAVLENANARLREPVRLLAGSALHHTGGVRTLNGHAARRDGGTTRVGTASN